MTTLRVAITGIGLLGPGLASWTGGSALLRDPSAWQAAPTVVPPPGRLPPTERRRAGTVVKASLVVADEAVAMAGADAASLATVFCSSTGDPANCHLLCEALAAPERLVSPTRFTNSVHNAPAGYWHIACASRAPSTSLAAFDASFAAGLLEAVVQCLASGAPVLLVACDLPYPEPLHRLRPVADAFALALVVAPADFIIGRGLALSVTSEATATPCVHAGLEAVRLGIPAARALPLLQALAGAAAARVVIEGLPGLALHAEVAPR
ncbi:3-oxoacyl-(acyl-carrier-protein) synthase [Rubrivivax sp. A210]|uniref:beta-ketoacyl synthase chain length factor n=1 Tax=Rubrivivax sp. A210 TaxID=2772301 RepID=UPI0019191578|nr:beta-ketoacyl synthase chain length factor [Rubrivivax sp. A210]CAD5372053.1 3-oxoacyl-(acyl-carrier-protein) synthase [Rubrivivax sp. A210]